MKRRLSGKIACAIVSVGYLLLQFAILSRQTITLEASSSGLFSAPDLESRRACLLQDDCVDHLARKLSRVWSLHELDSWCVKGEDPEDETESPSGLVLIKVPKSASSTLAGIVLRIQNRHNCTVHWKHKLAREYKWTDTKAIRVAPIRDPSARAMSSVYYHYVSFHPSKSPKDAFILQKLRETNPNYILDYTADRQLIANVSNTSVYISELFETIEHTVSSYQFLFVVDRLDESLLVWSWLTKLPWTDLITMSSKRQGSWYLSGKRCVSLAGASITPAISSFLESPDWKLTHAGDKLLYQVANKSLDRTIDELIGRNLFEYNLVKFRSLRQEIENACQNHTHFPCNQDGSPQLELAKKNCYVRDFGCGYPCIDQYTSEIKQQWF